MWLPAPACRSVGHRRTPVLELNDSCQPTLNPDNSLWRDIAVFNRLAIRGFHNYKRGDIVALKYGPSISMYLLQLMKPQTAV